MLTHVVIRFKLANFLLFFCLIAIGTSDCPPADLSGDCAVGLQDVVIFADSWLSSEGFFHPDLVARWRFDELEGETAQDDVNGYTGYLFGNPQWTQEDDPFRRVLFFDGTDDYVEITGYKGISGADSRTCAAWIKTSTAGAIMSWGNSNPVGGDYWYVFVNNSATYGNLGALHVSVWNGNIIGTTDLRDGEWHHIAVVMGSPDTSGLLLYVDGQIEESSYPSSHGINTIADANVYIGSRLGATSNLFNGLIDDVRIYDQRLADEEVLRLYQAGSAARHNPDFSVDNIVNMQDIIPLSRQWLDEEPAMLINEFLASNASENPPLTAEGQILDGNNESSDWIELFNQTDFAIDLEDWGLSDDADDLFKWRFPEDTVVEGRSYLLLFASSREESAPYVDPAGYLHTNFSLSADGEYLALTAPDGTVVHAYDEILNPDTSEYGFPKQEENISYGILNDEAYYFALPTPGGSNRQSFLGFVDAPQFSHERGYYDQSFSLILTTSTPGAVIRYTTDGSDPTLANGITYTQSIPITTSTSPIGRMIRAAAFKEGYRPSSVKTKTYLMNAPVSAKGLPAICLTGNRTQTFYNPNGILAIVGGYYSGGIWTSGGDPFAYNNPIGHGFDYERPVSLEYIRFADGEEFQEDCGIRVHGSAWMRPRYQPASETGVWTGDGKYSLRLYFRSDYGAGKLKHSILEKFPEVEEMDTFVLRAGHNDQTNPFVRDEMIRRLQYQMGNQASRGTFVNLYVNGVYKGYYNLCERIGEDFCQQWYNSDKEWDVVGWVAPATGSPYLEARDGDMDAFNTFINYAQNNNLSNPLPYAEVERQMDMPGFVDYLIAQTWGGNWDWPQNNWTAAAERSSDCKWRFFVWDAEGAMDSDYNRNRFSTLNSDSTHLSRLYRALKVNDDFKILFADRLQKHFLDAGGAMAQSNLTALFWELAAEVQSVIPYISTWIADTYIPQRESIFFNQCLSEGLFTFAAPHIYINAKEIQKDYVLNNSLLTMQNAAGVSGNIYYTLDGSDPRLSVMERTISTAKTLVAENAPKKVLVTDSVNSNWRTQLSFNDTSWTDGLPVDNTKTGGVGYENNPGETTSNVPYISYNIGSKMYGNYTTAYIRIPFTVDGGQMATWNYLTLKMRYDDRFVAYINGVEVCRTTTSSHENNSLETFVISNFLSVLVPGQNLLAIQGFNESKTSSDFVISPILEAGFNSSSGISPTAQKYTSPVALQKSAHIKARTLNGSQWGALHEAFVSVGPVGEHLRISEFLYHPNGDPNEEFVELTNIGSTMLNLNNVSFTKGIDYTFADTILAPAQYLLLVKDRVVFESRYGTGLPIAGEFAGALDNTGEKLQISDALGNPFQTFEYKDGWYEITDGGGFSLTAVDPAYEKTGISTLNLESKWTFNETSGANVYDATGLHHGTIFNMADTSRVYGPEDKSLGFDGYDDYIQVTGYKGVTGAASRTCTAWIKTSTTGAIMSWGNSNPAGGDYWYVFLNHSATYGNLGALHVSVWNGNIIGTTDLRDGEWHHIAVVMGSPDTSGLLLYVDGQLEESSYPSSHGINTIADADVYIGSRLGATSNLFNGLIDDVRIYSRALTADEIATMVGLCWDCKDLWRPSAVYGGTPGRAETAQEQLPLPGSVVINELLSHSHSASPDWIELHNTTDQSIAIGGWFISDSAAEPNKFQIPDGVILSPSNPYYVIEETRFNNLFDPACRTPFALSEGGETVYLQSAVGETLTGYLTQEEFDASETDVSFGRFQKSTGGWNFVPMSSPTQGEANAYPKVGPIIMTEIMYNPGAAPADKDAEYIELMNISDQPVRTAGYVSTYTSSDVSYDEWIPWRFDDGIEFEFLVNMTIEPGQRILLVKDLTAFNGKYTGVPAGTVILEWTSGSLDNAGEKIQLSIPGDQEFGLPRYYIRHDRVNYDDEAEWPVEADGTGKGLTHIRPMDVNNNYTNDAVNWMAADPTPGW